MDSRLNIEKSEECPDTDADMRSFIDDMSVATYGTEPEIYEVHGHMGQYLVKELRRKKGKISKKTTIVGSKFSHNLILNSKYRKIGVSSKIGLAAKRPWPGENRWSSENHDRNQR